MSVDQVMVDESAVAVSCDTVDAWELAAAKWVWPEAALRPTPFSYHCQSEMVLRYTIMKIRLIKKRYIGINGRTDCTVLHHGKTK